MGIFRKAVIEEVIPSTTYELITSHLFVIATEYKVYILSALFLLLSYILLVPLSSALDSYHKEVKVHHDTAETTTTLSRMLNVSEEEIGELTASSSINSASSTEEAEEAAVADDANDDEISDDGSVDYTYQDFVTTIKEQEDTLPELITTPTNSPARSITKFLSKKKSAMGGDDDDDRSIISSVSMREFKKKLPSFKNKSMRMSFKKKKTSSLSTDDN